jgi:hypothetical protein
MAHARRIAPGTLNVQRLTANVQMPDDPNEHPLSWRGAGCAVAIQLDHHARHSRARDDSSVAESLNRFEAGRVVPNCAPQSD